MIDCTQSHFYSNLALLAFELRHSLSFHSLLPLWFLIQFFWMGAFFFSLNITEREVNKQNPVIFWKKDVETKV